MTEPTAWHKGKLLGFDNEATGVDPFNDRIVTASLIEIDTTTGERRDHEWLINPGVDIPEGATRVHGITTEHAKEHGREPKAVMAEMNVIIRDAQAKGIPVVAFNAAYDLSLYQAECERHGVEPPVITRVVDPSVIDKHVAPYRKGPRKLENVCEVNGVKLENAHNATADTMGALRVAYVQAERNPSIQIPLDELHANQQKWKANQAAGLQRHFRAKKQDDTINIAPQWPVQRPDDNPDASASPLVVPEPSKKERPADGAEKIPAGRYAIIQDDGEAAFYVLDKPTTGKWAGHTFLKRQNGDLTTPVRGTAATAVIQKIAKAPKEAAIQYGKLLGICSMCNATLTNPASIEMGIGPICAKKFG